MMTAKATSLLDRLPPVRGRIAANVPLARYTWFRVGGPADILFTPADEVDLIDFLAARPAEVPITVLGVGSNLLVRDGGIDGIVVRLNRALNATAFDGDIARVGAGVLDQRFAKAAARAGLAGLEFLAGVPGTIGGAVRMNAGAYGREMADVVDHVRAIDQFGEMHRVSAAELGFGYRHSALSDSWIVVEAALRGTPDEPDAIAARMAEITADREASQPIRERTGGSTFVNPPGAKAWALIDRAGCRGLRRNGAMVSEKHCNFLINTGEATAADLEGLGEEVRRRVHETTGVCLTWEIRRIGRHLSEGPRAAADIG